MILGLFDEIMRVSRPDIYYLKRNFLSVMIIILITPLLYYLSFCYGLGSSVNDIEGVSYVAFVIPGVISLSTLTSCFSSIANKVLVQRIYYSSFDETMLCPISSSAVILGKAFIGFLKGMMGGAVLLLIGVLMSSDMHVTFLLILCMAISCITYSLLGVLAGFLSNNLTTVIMITSVVVVPMTFLCGTVFSTSSLPVSVQYIISVLPLSFSTECIRSAALGWSFPMLSMLVLIIYAVVFFLMCHYLLSKGKI